jgi:phenylacetate-CoA ligase
MIDLWTLLRSYAGARWRFRHLHGPALAAFQDRRARSIVAHAIRHSPFYRDHFAGHDPNDWRPLPAIDKQSMMQAFDAFNTAGVRLDEAMPLALHAEGDRSFAATINGLTVGLSSGTSGQRGLFVVDRAEQLRWAGTMLARALPSLRRRGLRLAFFLRSNSNLYQRLGAWIDFRYFDLTTPLADTVAALNALRPDLLAAPPSMLERLREARDRGALRIAPERLVSVAEVLEPQDEERLRASFGVPVHQVYQCTEGLLAVSCAEGSLHLQEDIVAVQFEPVSEHGNGRVTPIVTDLWRRTQPIVRYRLGDVLTLAPHPCACGSSFRVIERIEGRLDDIFRVPPSGPIFPDDFRRRILGAHPAIEDYQVRHSPSSLRIYVQSSAPFEEVAAAVRTAFAGLPVPLEIHPDLEPQTPGEKRRRVKRDLTAPLPATA